MTLAAPTLDDRNLSDQIYGHLRGRILAGRFRPGDRLSEVAIAEEFGVSRAPVREALRQLASHGLAEKRARKGVYVPSFHADAYQHLSELREGLETMAARLAAERATSDSIAALGRLLTQTSNLIEEPDGAPYPAHLDIHALIAEASGNPVLIEKIRETNTRLELVRLLSGMSQGRAARAYDEHRAIVRAIEAGDPDAAAKAMRDHLRHAFEHAGDVLEAPHEADPSARGD
jgi:DNA-binding GntR family transcriptional regulator